MSQFVNKDDLIAHLAARFERLSKAASALYYAAHWKADRDCEADALWKELRDAAGMAPGLSASRLGPPRH